MFAICYELCKFEGHSTSSKMSLLDGMSNRARQLYKNISMLFVSGENGKLTTGVNTERFLY